MPSRCKRAVRPKTFRFVVVSHFKTATVSIVVLTFLGIIPLEVTPVFAQSTLVNQTSLDALQKSIAQQEEKLNEEELQLEQQSLQLSQQQRLLDSEMAKLHGTGTSAVSGTNSEASDAPSLQNGNQTANNTNDTSPGVQTAQTSEAVGQQQQQQQQSQQQQNTKIILQSATTLTNAGGILTPKGQFVVDPSFEYDYYSQNQLALNGFTIIPGITFGNIFIAKVEQNFLTTAMTLRYGITDRLEINAKIPLVAAFGTTTTQAVGPSARPLTADANNFNIGDVQVGGAYQFNSGDNGWPVFVGNLIFKTVTGQSPYQTPVYTVNDPNGQFLEGIPKKLPTGTGFYSLEPSVTVFYATDPGVIFGNLQYIYNFSRSFDVANPAGGAAVPESLEPGGALAGTFGFGFAMNDKASMTFSYEQEHVFGSSVSGQSIGGSGYSFGTFNFGVGYQVSPRTSINLGVGIGAGPNAPAAKILLDVPFRFNG